MADVTLAPVSSAVDKLSHPAKSFDAPPAVRVARYQNQVKTTLESLPIPDLKRATREEVITYFENGWNLFETLKAAIVDDEAFYMAPDRLRRPLVFYLGHTAVLFVNKMLGAKLIEDRVHPHFECIFAVGVDEMSWDDMAEDKYSWPPLEEVWAYRKQVHDIIISILSDPARMQIPVPADELCWDHPLWALAMGFEHERIHLETSSVLIRQLPVELTAPPPGWRYAPASTPNKGDAAPLRNEFLPVNGGSVTVGKDMKEGMYGWDNEYGYRTELVQPFRASKYLVSNREFYEFVVAGGYENESYWDEEGWKWRSYRDAHHPTWWVPAEPAPRAEAAAGQPTPDASPALCRVGPSVHDSPMLVRTLKTALALGSRPVFRYRAMWDELDMPWDWPAEINYHEAAAYCRWLGPGHRLPTEAEYLCMRGCSPLTMPAGTANVEMAFGSPTPVDFYPPNHNGFHDIRGNVWQWSEEWAHALEGFKVHPLYDDFSTPCFDDRHNMIFGGSWASTGDEATPFARFYFRRHFFQHAGFRVVKSEHAAQNGREARDARELDLLVNAHMAFYYAEPADLCAWPQLLQPAADYPLRLAAECRRIADEVGAPHSRALELGCSVGRTSFDLARHFDFVMGIDTTARFISACHALRSDKMKYKMTDEDGTELVLTANVDAAVDRLRTEFWQSNLCNLPRHYGMFDVVLVADPLRRLEHAQPVVEHAKDFVSPGGLLVVAAPYDPCCPSRAAGDTTALAAVMSGFSLVAKSDVPFASRQTGRQFRVGVSLLTAWRRDAA